MSNKKIVMIFSLMLMFALLLNACGAGSTEEAPVVEQPTAEGVEAEEMEEPAAAGGGGLICVIVPGVENPFF
ncbi:MAG: hypothetical protein AB8I58_03985, partial [Anaerolineales bacterium]